LGDQRLARKNCKNLFEKVKGLRDWSMAQVVEIYSFKKGVF
jgi:hypothetical protein